MADIIPNCRYGHGDLMLVKQDNGEQVWGYVSRSELTVLFAGNIYMCEVCGYTEFFDNDIPSTTKRIVK